MRIFSRLAFCLLAVSILMAACAPQVTPQAVVEQYLTAIVEKNDAAISTLTCADFAATAIRELDSFRAVATRLEGVSCETIAAGDDVWSVACQGNIVATYGAEDQNFDVSRRVYRVVLQGGNYLVCGYE